MLLLSKIASVIYFTIWTLFILFAYTFLTDDYYITGKMFGIPLGVFAFTVYFITIIILTIAFVTKPLKRTRIKKNILIYSSPLALLIPVAVAYLLPNNLETQQHNIQVSYTAWGCDCANGSLDVDNGKPNKTDRSDREHVFIEAANSKIILPDSIGRTGDVVQLTGQFYEKKGFPKGYSSPEFPEKARVFRYTGYKIVQRDIKTSEK